MTRREFASACAAASSLRIATSGRAADSVTVGHDPQLFLDDFLVAEMRGLARQVQQPQRLPQPVLASATFGTTQPYLSVLYDRDWNKYRIWYNRGNPIWHAESVDGLHWTNPRVAWDLPRSYGCSLIDDGERERDASLRYKLANWQSVRALDDTPQDVSGMYVGCSPDGLRWTPHAHQPVLPTWPDGWPKVTRHGVGDIVDVYFDPLNHCYQAACKLFALPEDGYPPAPKAGNTFRRLVGMSESSDFIHWQQPWRIHVPDARDEGLLEFYGMGGMHVRGSLRIGLVRVLRDDLPCEAGGPKDGIGYTVLATSRDGQSWRRFREPFLDRNLKPGSWDHAMTWCSGVLPVRDELYLYYGGYARGHKIEPQRERQIGLARMKRDRYVALVPTRSDGILTTKVFALPSERMTVNARATGGEIRVRLLDAARRPLAAAAPILGDQLNARVRWQRSIVAWRGKAVALELQVRRASLFAFQFDDPVVGR